MILVDTSVWIEYFRKKDSPVTKRVQDLLDTDAVVLSRIAFLELLSGAKKTEIPKLMRVFSAFPLYLPSEKAWTRIENWIQTALDQGQRFSATDLLIASTTVDHNAVLWSLDSDYKRMEKLGFLKLYQFYFLLPLFLLRLH